MAFSSFLKLVEIQTKIASMIPFSLGTIFAIYHFNSFILKNFIIMFISVIAFDMATTAINNYIDYKKAIKKNGYGYESHNAIVKENIKESTVLLVIILLLFIATFFGVILFLSTDIIVLLLGAISFFVGIHYTFGPIPISRMPIGEMFSGLFMGFVITLLSVYIHIYDQNIISILYTNGILNLKLNILEVLYIFFIAIPPICGIANIMLANNICDIEDDIENKRYTLPIYIGKEKSLKLFEFLYYLIYIDIIVLILLGIEPMLSILTIFTFIPVKRNIKLFLKKQSKKETFVIALKNFLLINITRNTTLAIATIISYIV